MMLPTSQIKLFFYSFIASLALFNLIDTPLDAIIMLTAIINVIGAGYTFKKHFEKPTIFDALNQDQ